MFLTRTFLFPAFKDALKNAHSISVAYASTVTPVWSLDQWERWDEELQFWLSTAIRWFTEDLNPSLIY